MIRKRFLGLFVINVVFTGAVFTGALSAATFMVPSDRSMVDRSDTIVVATAMTSRVQLSADGRIETVTGIHVDQVLKGNLLGDFFIHEPGGILGDRATVIPGVPRFEEGSRSILFLTRTPQQTWAVTDLVLGKFQIADDHLGHRLALRDEGEIVGWDSSGEPYHEPRRDASKFIEFIRGAARGENPRADYLLGRQFGSSPEAAQEIVTSSGQQFPATTLATYSGKTYTFDLGGGNGGRWNVFPNPVTFFSGATTEPGAPGGGVTAVQNALAAWDNDCGSNVNYVYGGVDSTHTKGVSAADGANTILFERNLSAYGIPPFSCSGSGYSGTLGVGGITATSGSHVFNGETYYTTQEGDVEMNQGIANCSLLFSNGDFNSAVAHEVGHTLGFRHSDQTRADNPSVPCSSDPTLECSTLAIMKAFIPNGINGTLQQWDIDAVRSVYTSACAAAGVKGDFNGDGRVDLLFQNTGTNQLYLWYMSGTSQTGGTFVSPNPDPGWKVVAAGDLSGDGRPDILFRNSAGQLDVWYVSNNVMVGGTILPAPTNSSGQTDPNWQVVGMADINGDGNQDVVFHHSLTGQNYVWYFSHGTYIGGAALPNASDTSWNLVAVGDFNGDGHPDLFFRKATGENYIFFLSGTTLLSGGAVGTADPIWRVGAVADYNGDGRADLFWQNTSNQGYLWLMNGTVPTGAGYLNPTPDANWQIVGPK
jgi:hypothetical protein